MSIPDNIDPKAQTETMLAKARIEYAIAEITNDTFLTTIKDRVLTLPPAKEKEGYELRRKTIADLRKIRTQIESRRKELKADSLEYGRRIDAFAKYYTAQIMAIEEPLRLEKEAVDQEKENERKEREAKIRAQQEEEARQRIAAEEARLKEIRDAEDKRIKEEQAKREAELEVERAKLREAAARLQKIEAEQREAQQKAEQEHLARLQIIEKQTLEAQERQRAEQAKIDADRRALDAEMETIKRKEQDARAEAERKEQEAKDELERLARAERIKPDIVKLKKFCDDIKSANETEPPKLTDPILSAEAKKAFESIWQAIFSLENFIAKHNERKR